MLTVQIPTFDEFNNYTFTGFVTAEIKEVPNFEDINTITRHLPGIPQGGCGREPLKDLLTDKKKDVRSFYDTRQNTKKLKGYYVTLLGVSDYFVTVDYGTISGNPATKTAVIKANTPTEASRILSDRVRGYKRFMKMHGGSATLISKG